MHRGIVFVIAVSVAAAPVLADGGFVGPDVSDRAQGLSGVTAPGQKGIVIDAGDGTELLILQTTYRGPAEDFAWIVPVPDQPPIDGTFEPSSDFIDWIFLATGVDRRTDIEVQRPAESALGVTAGEEGLLPGQDPGAVTVHQRMAVGDYDAAVLSASDEDALAGWLDRHGYAASAASAPALRDYTERGWYFIALRVRPELARRRPVMTDVQPIALRFPARRLVYPLLISRYSAPERTAISLVVMADRAVRCRELTAAQVEPGYYPAGSSWARLRREAIEAKPSAILREALWQTRIPTDLEHLRAGEWALDHEHKRRKFVATRLWTLLEPDAMVDLTFEAGARAVSRPVVRRTASVRDIFARSPLATVLAGIAFVLALVIGARRNPLPLPAVRLAAAVGMGLTLWGVQPVTLFVLPFAVLIVLLLSNAGPRPGAFRWRKVGEATTLDWLVVMGFSACLLGIVAHMVFVGGPGLLPLILVIAAAAIMWLWIATERGRQPADKNADDTADTGEDEAELRPRMSAAEVFAWTVAGTGWAAVMVAAGTATAAPVLSTHGLEVYLTRAYRAIASVLPPYTVLIVAELAWLLLVGRLLTRAMARWRTGLRSVFVRALIGSIMLALVGILVVPIPGIFSSIGEASGFTAGLLGLLHVLALIAMMALLSFGLVAPWAGDRSRAVAQGLAAAALLMGILTVAGWVGGLEPAEAGSGPSKEAQNAAEGIHRALMEIDEALEAFRDDTGAYPMTLRDLCREQPDQGVDASGNGVSPADDARGPWLRSLPVDPLTGRRDTWVYEVTGSPMVSSGGFDLHIDMETRLRGIPGQRRRSWNIERAMRDDP